MALPLILGLFFVWSPPATLQQSVLVLFSVFYISFAGIGGYIKYVNDEMEKVKAADPNWEAKQKRKRKKGIGKTRTEPTDWWY